MFSINDPNVSKVTIQLTTIHGDPDLFISRKTKTPSFKQNERRSIRCGMFPEIIEIRQNDKIPGYETLEGEYYIAAFGFV